MASASPSGRTSKSNMTCRKGFISNGYASGKMQPLQKNKYKYIKSGLGAPLILLFLSSFAAYSPYTGLMFPLQQAPIRFFYGNPN